MSDTDIIRLFQAFSTLQKFPGLANTKKIEKRILEEFKRVEVNKRGKKVHLGITYHNNGYCYLRGARDWQPYEAILPPFAFTYPEQKVRKEVTPTREHAKKFRCYGPLLRMVCRKQFGLDCRKRKHVDEDWFLKLYDHYLTTKTVEVSELKISLREAILDKLDKTFYRAWTDDELMESAFIDTYLSKIFNHNEYREHSRRDEFGCRVTLPLSERMVSTWIDYPRTCSTRFDWDPRDDAIFIPCRTFPEFLEMFKAEIKKKKMSVLTEVAKDMGIKL